MKNRPQPEHNDHAVQKAHIETSTLEINEEQMLLDYLLETGFALEEAGKLLNMREHLYDNVEMRQRMSEDCRMHFARWLYEQGEISEI